MKLLMPAIILIVALASGNLSAVEVYGSDSTHAAKCDPGVPLYDLGALDSMRTRFDQHKLLNLSLADSVSNVPKDRITRLRGLRLGVLHYHANERAMKEQLIPFRFIDQGNGYVELSLVGYLVRRGYSMEMEFTYGGSNHFDYIVDLSHGVGIETASIVIWLRREIQFMPFHKSILECEILPGISMGYGSADISIGSVEHRKSNETLVGEKAALIGEGWIYSCSMGFRWLVLLFEYRYRYWKINDDLMLDVGNVHFRGRSKLDLSANVISIALDIPIALKE